MPKVKLSLNKTSQTKLNKLYKILAKRNPIFEDQGFQDRLKQLIQYDVRYIVECSEKSIMDAYYMYADQYFTDTLPTEHTFELLKSSVRSYLAGKYTNKTFDNNIDIYFNDVKREYIYHPQSESADLEFTPENRDIFIKNNLKLVVSVAKTFQNRGLPFEDLIQIGNMGLFTAFDRFDKNKSNLRNIIIKEINESINESFSFDEASKIISDSFKYDDNLLNKTISKLPMEGFASKEKFLDWVHSNIKPAVFASVAFMWIRGYIGQELDKYSSIIRFPKDTKKRKKDTNNDEENNDAGISKTIIRLDSINPYTDDCYNDKELSEISNEEFAVEDSYITNKERDEMFKNVLDDVLIKLPALDRRIIQKKYGVNYPYAMNNLEIAENERISINEVKYSLAKSLQFLANEISPEMRDSIRELFT